MIGFIYKITNDINTKVYISKTLVNIQKRFATHIKDSKSKTKEARPLYNAFNKYGTDHFKIELIETCDSSILSEREIYWINYYDSYKTGYNATRGGDGKILYDYDLILKLYQDGLTETDIKKQLGCDISIVKKVLNNNGIDTNFNKIIKASKAVAAYDLNDNLLHEFISMSEAGRWLIANNITNMAVKDISTAIGRAASGKRKTAFSIKWKFIS